MGIVDEDVQRVRDDADIVGVVSQYTALKRSGRQWMGLCPFHGEKTPSFSVSAEKNVFYCFGCQRSGDVITFVQEIEGLDFVASVEWLAARANVQLRYTDRADGHRRRRRSELLDLVAAAADFYHRRLMEAPDAGPARAYLRDRGYDRDTVARFQLGWAPDGWDSVARHLKLTRERAEASGLAFVNKAGRLQDSFRARVMFPIADVNGAVVGFGGRQLPGGDPPKYKNTANNELYDKSKVLYGLDRAKQQVVADGEVVVCEGYTDVIGFHRAGIGRAVATCGTALTDSHVEVMKRFANRIVLAFDADGAGRAAADRFYEWERAFDVQVFVADLPDGVDPGELAGTDPDRLAAAVSGARPFLGFRLARVLEAADLSNPEGRARAAQRAAAVVAEHPSDLVRDQYLMEVADRLDIDVDRLRTAAVAARRAQRPERSRGRSRSESTDSGPDGRAGPGRHVRDRDGRDDVPGDSDLEDDPASAVPVDRAEVLLLRLLVDEPGALGGRIQPILFESPVARTACEALRSGAAVPVLLDDLPPDVAGLVGQVAMGEPPDEPDTQLALVARRATARVLDRLRRQQKRRSLDDARKYQPSIDWLAQCLDHLTDPARGAAVIDLLVPWLTEQEARERGSGAAP